MVFVKKICPPERRKATIAVNAKPSSPTISINDTTNGEEEGNEQFQFCISLKIIETTRPGQPITICTSGSVFAPAHPDGGLDTLAQRTAYLMSTSDGSRWINLGRCFLHNISPDPPLSPDLKERFPTRLLTIPADGEVVVAHDLPLARIFEYEQRLKPADIVGETWRMGIASGMVGTSWWSWGGLDGELKYKRLSAWRWWSRCSSVSAPTGDEWVTSGDPKELAFVDQTEDATFRFVE